MKTYNVKLEKDGDDLILTFPPEFLESVGWKEGDILEWVYNQDGTWSIKKDDTV